MSGNGTVALCFCIYRYLRLSVTETSHATVSHLNPSRRLCVGPVATYFPTDICDICGWGRVIMYANRITGSMQRAMDETERRRTRQIAYNNEHGITPQTVQKNVDDVLSGLYSGDTDMGRITASLDAPMVGENLASHLGALRGKMREAAENLEFEEAARLRDEVKRLEAVELAVADDPLARQFCG